MSDDFFKSYFEYTADNECPAMFHRWSAIVGLGAYMGRGCYIPHGHFKLYPNIYALLIASPGSRKSTGINIIRKLLLLSSYNNFAPKKTTKEKFLMQLGNLSSGGATSGDILDAQLFGDDSISLPAELLIAAGEFTEFFGNDILSFCSMLGEMWDWEGKFENEVKNSSCSMIYDPTISILGGTTQETFSETFPTGIIGQGFFSRILLVHTDKLRDKITWPAEPDAHHTAALLAHLIRVKSNYIGRVEISATAKKLLDKIYKSWEGVDDVRFSSYATRRFTHLLKLCLVHSAARLGKEISETDVVYANTVLFYAETFMPKALGEFGRSRNSDIIHKILQIVEASSLPMSLNEIFAHIASDVDGGTKAAAELIHNMVIAGKLQSSKQGFMPKRQVKPNVHSDVIDYNLLTDEERSE